jgi:hypothetical protein
MGPGKTIDFVPFSIEDFYTANYLLSVCFYNQANKKTNSVALVRKRTIPNERPPLVGEVSANFSG